MLQLIVGSNEESAVFELSDCPDPDVADVASAASVPSSYCCVLS